MQSSYIDGREIPDFDEHVSRLVNDRKQSAFAGDPPKSKVGACNHDGEIYRVVEPHSMGEYIGFPNYHSN